MSVIETLKQRKLDQQELAGYRQRAAEEEKLGFDQAYGDVSSQLAKRESQLQEEVQRLAKDMPYSEYKRQVMADRQARDMGQEASSSLYAEAARMVPEVHEQERAAAGNEPSLLDAVSNQLGKAAEWFTRDDGSAPKAQADPYAQIREDQEFEQMQHNSAQESLAERDNMQKAEATKELERLLSNQNF